MILFYIITVCKYIIIIVTVIIYDDDDDDDDDDNDDDDDGDGDHDDDNDDDCYYYFTCMYGGRAPKWSFILTYACTCMYSMYNKEAAWPSG